MKTNQQSIISKPPHGLPPLPLSQTETGALATAPLSTVVNSATDNLYQDLYTLVHGEVKIVSVASSNNNNSAATEGGDATNNNNSSTTTTAQATESGHAATSVEEKLTAAALGVATTDQQQTVTNSNNKNNNPNDAGAILHTQKSKMSNLSFAQRRHELTRRIVQHTKSISHVYALTASCLPKSHSAILQTKALHKSSTSPSLPSSPSRLGGARILNDPPPRLGASIQLSSDALQYVKNGWVSQDEAQDALYFHHDGLWKARAHCHDVLGALCVLSTPTADDVSGSEEVGGGGGGGRWPDFPTDVALAVDRYETSNEKLYTPFELQARLASAVRRKLVLGEVGSFHHSSSNSSISRDTTLPWRVILDKDGSSIRLTHGTPRTVSTAEALRQRHHQSLQHEDNNNLQQYPIEARLSVLSEDVHAPWKLLSIHVQCSPKTGESDHQLVLNKKQMFDLHRIGERCMIVEEAICRKKANEEEEEDAKNNNDNNKDRMVKIVPRPLERLFEVTHAFALSLQMEILSSQADALRRGAWGGGSLSTIVVPTGPSSGGGSSSGGRWTRGPLNECIEVSPVYFFDGKKGSSEVVGSKNDDNNDNDGNHSPIAVMAVHFWSCDDRYGSPRVGDLQSGQTNNNRNDIPSTTSSSKKVATLNQQRDDNFLPKSDRRGEKRLSLCIRAVPTKGLVVSLSGGSDVVTLSSTNDTNGIDKSNNNNNATISHHHHMQRNVDKLLSSIQDPFQLSMSDALLAATVLCADRRCRAVVDALNNQSTDKLPSYIHLEVECGTISVAAVISYPTTLPTSQSSLSSSAATERSPTVLFRLACDSRTGKFVPVFPRPASLLRLLACNDPLSSDIQLLRSAAMVSALGARSSSASSSSSGRNINKRRVVDGTSRESTGRIVRDAFDALSRSMDTLGRKCGVGGRWNDIDSGSASLREKSVNQTCSDVRASLMTCCGMASVFGVAAIALKIAGGVDPEVDVAGGIIDNDSSLDHLIRIPPLSIRLCQNIVEKIVKEGDGETKRTSHLQSELFAVSAQVTNDTMNLVCFDVLTSSDSASSVPTRIEYAIIEPPNNISNTEEEEDFVRPSKKQRIHNVAGVNSECHHTLEEVRQATLWIDAMLQ